jgi:23S rRNA pseudouridine1911/1915/1917 synthase
MPARSFIVGRHQAGRPVVELLEAALHRPRAEVLHVLRSGGVRLGGAVCTDPQRRVRSGQRVQVQANQRPVKPSKPKSAPAPPGPLARRIVLRHVDDDIIVVEKPAGLTTVRHKDEVASLGGKAKKFLPSTLVDLLPAVLAAQGHRARGRVRAVHRLDRETSGLLVLARTAEAERDLGKQFRAHAVGRTYLAVVRGHATEQRIESSLVRDRGDGRRGSGPPGQGQHAVTHVRVVERLGACTLIECELETGRTHQVRIHLGEAGTPLCGERVYDRPLHGQPLPDPSGAARPMLHAASLALNHPATGQRLNWRARPPDDMAALLRRLRSAGSPRTPQW